MEYLFLLSVVVVAGIDAESCKKDNSVLTSPVSFLVIGSMSRSWNSKKVQKKIIGHPVTAAIFLCHTETLPLFMLL